MADIFKNFSRAGKFYINGEIGDDFTQQILAPFREEITTRALQKTPQPIEIYITSPGGYLHEAFDMVTAIEGAKTSGVPVHTYVTSYAASAGSVIAVAGHKRFVGRRAAHMIHYARIWKYSENPVSAEREFENARWTQSELVALYAQYSKLEDIPNKLLADSYWVNGGSACIEAGLADELLA